MQQKHNGSVQFDNRKLKEHTKAFFSFFQSSKSKDNIKKKEKKKKDECVCWMGGGGRRGEKERGRIDSFNSFFFFNVFSFFSFILPTLSKVLCLLSLSCLKIFFFNTWSHLFAFTARQ